MLEYNFETRVGIFSLFCFVCVDFLLSDKKIAHIN